MTDERQTECEDRARTLCSRIRKKICIISQSCFISFMTQSSPRRNLTRASFPHKKLLVAADPDPDDVFTVARLLGQSCRHHCRSLYPLDNLAASTRHQCQVSCQHVIHLPLNRSEVERLRGSLLGCADSKSSGGEEEEMTTEEKCVYEYNLTLSFESTMGR